VRIGPILPVVIPGLRSRTRNPEPFWRQVIMGANRVLRASGFRVRFASRNDGQRELNFKQQKRLSVMVLLYSLTTAAHADSPLAPSFTEDTATSGISSVYKGEWQYMVGGGAASFDCNGDNFPDLLLAGGEAKATFFRNVSKEGGELKFTEEQSGLELDAITGAYPLDVDGDGNIDIVALRVGENVIFRGKGECKFERANEAWNFDGGDGWSTSFAATWERGAKWPTIAIGNYIDRTEEISPWGSCTDNLLYRPDPAGGKFAVTIPLTPSYCPLSMLFTDWNRSGVPSLRVSNDREYYEGGQEQMWKVEQGAAPALYTAAEGWKPLRIWGMGIASADVTGDGYPDYFLTSMADNKLQTLTAPPADGKLRPDYADIAYKRGVTAHRPYQGDDLRSSTAWHTQFEDVNNDGLADLFIAKGNVAEMKDFAMKDPNNLLVQGADGTFVEMGGIAGVDSTAHSRGAALADFNLDGLVDLVVVNRNENAQIWRNTTKDAGGFVAIELKQDGANRDAIGSWVEMRLGDKIVGREVTSGGGHAGGAIGPLHFGMGSASEAEARITWPDGAKGGWSKVSANSRYTFERGKFMRVLPVAANQ
jgi:enediyne biosynthesis protein E4